MLVGFGSARVMVDCGADWLHRVQGLAPDAIVITHAHPDHAWGLAQGAPCPVFATAESCHAMAGTRSASAASCCRGRLRISPA